jgi:multiple sugar transport system permease protein
MAYLPLSRRFSPSRALMQTVLLVGVIAMVFPFLYMIGTSFKPAPETIAWPPTILPKQPTLDNYQALTTKAPFARYFLNTLIVAIVSTLGILFTSTLAGFIFAKYRFPFRNLLFIIVLASSMVPFETYLIPLYLIAKDLKLINTYQGIAAPYLIMSFGVFFMRQAIGSSIPDELLDAARIDGASEWRIFRQIIVPLSSNAIGALGILAFIQAWTIFIWPLILATQREMFTMEIGLVAFQHSFTIDYGGMMAGSTVSILPIVIVFLLLRRQIIEGVTLTGLKG